MSFEKLDYIMVVAEEQNLTKAAARLFITQPALTAAINKIEEEVGAKLFERKRPPIKLTPAGVLYIAEMNRIRQIQMNMQTQITALSKKPFTISIGGGRGQYWLPVLLPHFQERHPDVHISIQGGVYKQYEKEYEYRFPADIVFGSLRFSNPHVEEETLMKERLIYVIPKKLGIVSEAEYGDSSLQRPLVIDASILNGQCFVCPEATHTYFHYMEREMLRYHFRYGELIVYGTPQAALLLASGGMGITFVPSVICGWENIDAKFDVYYCTLDSEPLEQSIKVFYQKNSPNSYLVQDMISLTKDKLIPKLYNM